ncbi:MAG: hypothetical protein WC547_06550 [Candidatus Omnitrophota bacterium]
MELDPFSVICKAFVLIVFGVGLMLSVVFTVAINVFWEWEQKIEDVDMLSRRILDPIQRRIHWWEEWLVINHSFFGFCFMLCSLWEIVMLIKLADKF